MSSLVFPSLQGLDFNGKRTPQWSTGIQPAMTGKESRIAYRQYPMFRFDITYQLLRDDIATSDLKALVGLFNSVQGRFDTFLYTDPDFNSVTTEPFGTGDAVTQIFQLVAKYQNAGGPGYSELIQNLNGAPQIRVNGVLKTLTTDYTIGPTGIITFVVAPAAAAALTWTGSFYYRVRFGADELDVAEIMDRWWKSGQITLQSIKL